MEQVIFPSEAITWAVWVKAAPPRRRSNLELNDARVDFTLSTTSIHIALFVLASEDKAVP